MFAAEEQLSSPWIVIACGLCAALAAGAVKVFDALSKYREKQDESKRKGSRDRHVQGRRDKLVQAKIKRDEERRVNAEYRALVQGLRDQVAGMDKRLLATVEAERMCQVRAARLEAEIRFLQYTARRLSIQAKDDCPGARGEALIMADHRGTIRKVNHAFLTMFHYADESEVVGKNVEVLIPEDLREQHRQGFARAAESGQPPWEERTILGDALTRDGRRLPVSVNLSAWRDDKIDGGVMFSAAVVRRYTAEQESLDRDGVPPDTGGQSRGETG